MDMDIFGIKAAVPLEGELWRCGRLVQNGVGRYRELLLCRTTTRTVG